MKLFIAFVFILLFAPGSQAQHRFFQNSNGIAINGYDPVAYFLQQKAIPGIEEYSYNWGGSVWYFSSDANADSFRINPEKYAPQFGGYCAYGCSENHESPTDPKAYTIIDGKLYLNYNMKVRKYWLNDTTARIKKANEFWISVNK